MLSLDASCPLMQSSASMPLVFKLQKDAAIYSKCVCQALVDIITADYTDKFAWLVQHMPACCIAQTFEQIWHKVWQYLLPCNILHKA